MRITIKLFASLDRYLPQGSTDNQAEIEVDDDLTVAELLARLRIPGEHCHLVLVNGTYISPRHRSETVLRARDEIAVWPQVAGG